MSRLNFSSLVLMEKDKENGMLTTELGSYEVEDGADYITKMYMLEDVVNVFFDTNKDVEEWEYSAIYDLFDEEIFKSHNYEIEFIDEEYNPTWLVKFDYEDDYDAMKEKINEICALIKDEMEKTFERIEGKEDEYK
jgi:hypothetical protein